MRPLYDRFIPWRSTADFDLPAAAAGFSSPYRARLEDAMPRRGRVLFCRCPSPEPKDHDGRFAPPRPRPHPRRELHRALHAPRISDDGGLHPLDWGKNLLAVAQDNRLSRFDSDAGYIGEVTTFPAHKGPISSVSWAPDGLRLAVGLGDSDIQLWDVASRRMLTSLLGVMHGRVASLHWGGLNLVASGRENGFVVIDDVRVGWRRPGSVVCSLVMGHSQEVSALRWSPCGWELVSGGRDNQLFVWDLRNKTTYKQKFTCLPGAVKAVAWSPRRSHVLAVGAGTAVRMWDTQTGKCLSSLDTGSEVSGLLWSKSERELVTCGDQVAVWKYPSMEKMEKLYGHASPVLFTAPSPEGCRMATAADDKIICLWNLFEDTESPSGRARKPNNTLFSTSSLAHIRLGVCGFAWRSSDGTHGIQIPINGKDGPTLQAYFCSFHNSEPQRVSNGDCRGMIKLCLWNLFADGDSPSGRARKPNITLFLYFQLHTHQDVDGDSYFLEFGSPFSVHSDLLLEGSPDPLPGTFPSDPLFSFGLAPSLDLPSSSARAVSPRAWMTSFLPFPLLLLRRDPVTSGAIPDCWMWWGCLSWGLEGGFQSGCRCALAVRGRAWPRGSFSFGY